MNIHVYIGTSGAGKTTLIEERYLKNISHHDVTIDNMPVCRTEFGTLLLGKYGVEKRCKGCDTLSMTIIDDLIKFVDKHIHDDDIHTIVVDGDRVNNEKFFDFLLKYQSLVTVTYLQVPMSVILQRLPDGNKSFIQTTETKSRNIYNKYYDKLKFEKITVEVPNPWW